MEEVPGKHDGTFIYVYDGHVYHSDKRCNGIYRCSSRRSLDCYGVLKRNQDETYTLKTSHNHPPNETTLQEVEMKQEMLRICRETIMKPKDIFDMVCRRNSVAAKNLTYRTMRSFLYREQVRHRPEIPQTIVRLEVALMNYQPAEHIYKGTVLSDNGYRAVLFTTDTLLNALATSTEIFMDGTFSVVPRVPSFAQLYTIHIRYMDTGIPVLFILCQKRTVDVYNAIWRRVKELRPDALQGVQSVMSDYERAAMTVARETFPEARITGCWFHFNQAVLRRWKALGLMVAPRKVLGFTMALPLAPVNAFEEGLRIIQEEADLISTEYPAVLQFTVYLRRVWLPLKEKVSVFGTPIRTNNFVESFHYVLFHRFGGIHPNIWHFVHDLGELLLDQEINIGRLAEGRSVKRVRVRHNVRRDKRIAEAQASLSSGRLSLREFLQTLSNVSQMPEESFDLQAPDSLDDTLGYQETIDSNLLDTHTAAPIIDESEPDSEPLLMDNIRTNEDSPQRSRGRLRLRRRGCNLQRAAPIINESEPDSESLLMGNIRTNENSPQRSRGRLRLRRRGCNLQRATIIAESESNTESNSEPILENIIRSNDLPPRSRGRPRRRGRNLQTFSSECLPTLTDDELASTNRTRRSRGRPPNRRGRRGRFARLPRVHETADLENIFHTPNDDIGAISPSDSDSEQTVRPFSLVTDTIASNSRTRASSESLHTLTDDELAFTIRSRRSRGRPPNRRGRRGRFARLPGIVVTAGHTSTEQENEQEQTEVVYTSESDQNETHNEDFENIFRTPEDDFGAIGLSDSEQTDLPFLPVAALTGTNSSKSRTSGMCCTCLNATAEYIFIPCGHLCICDDCQKQLEDEKCPLCRETYTICIRAITT